MNTLILIAAAGYGACLGSFLNVCIFRLPRRCLRLWKPKLSFCPSCHRTLPWYENLPLVAYLGLAGRCRGCRTPIPLRYFFVELATTLFFLWVASQQLMGEERHWGLAIVQVLYFAALLVCALVDLDHMIIPDEIDIPGYLAAPFVVALVPAMLPRMAHVLRNDTLDAGLTSVIGAATGALVIWTIGWVGGKISRNPDGAMGFGDVKFVAMIGGLTGWQGALSSLLLGSLVGSVFGVVQRLRGGTNVVPFGPYLALGAAAFAFIAGYREWFLLELDMLGAVTRFLVRGAR